MTSTVREYTAIDFINWASDIEVSDLDFFFLYYDGSRLSYRWKWLIAWFFVENPAFDLLPLEEPLWAGVKEHILKPYSGVHFDSGLFDWSPRG